MENAHLFDYSSTHIFLVNNNPPYSGVGRYAYSLFEALRKLGKNEIKLVTLDQQLFDKAFRSLKYPFNWFYYITKLKIIARKLNVPHFVHIANNTYLLSLIPRLNQEAKGIVVTVHDLFAFTTPHSMGSAYIRKLTREIFDQERIDGVITCSRNTYDDLIRFISKVPRRVRVIHYGVDHSVFQPRSKSETLSYLKLPKRPIVLHVGREAPWKGIPTLLRSFKELLKWYPSAILLRVGWQDKSTKRIIKSLGLENKIIYRSSLDKNIAYYYNASDVLVFPSHYEGFGNPVLEAMASGCPVIASNKASIPEIVGDSGVLLDPTDVEGFATWMYEMLSNENLRQEFSKKALERSLLFSWERCAKETFKFYREVFGL